MENAQIAEIFDEIADLLELQEANAFRVRSYRNAARTVRNLSERLEDLRAQDQDLSQLPNIGESTAGKIEEILEKGTCQRLEEQRAKVPAELTTLMRVPGLGPRKAMQVFRELDIKDLESLRQACEDHKVRELEGFGEKTEESILQGIETVESTSGRILYHDAEGFVETLRKHLDACETVKRHEVAGSFRRCKETIGDLDILVLSDDRGAATEEITAHEAIASVDSKGQERVTVRLDSGLQVDFRFFAPEAFGAALLYFTGSKAHNVAVRSRARDRDWKLSEYGLFKGDNLLAGKTEEAVYGRLGMLWVPPELREDRGEVEAAENDDLPELVTLDDIKGDLHAHTDRTDGSATLQEMVEAARDRGYAYLAITDHSKAVTMANGLDDEAVRGQAAAIREMDEKTEGIHVLAGIEVDILKDGTLDLKEETLAGLDWVVASVHYNRNLGEKQMTDRFVAAVKSGVVHCLGHLTGRLIGKRDPVPFNVGRVFEACAENGVCLEIDAQPDRLDLPDTYCKEAAEMGIRFVVGTDAHSRRDLEFMRLGVNVARRGWLRKKDVLNSRPWAEFKSRM